MWLQENRDKQFTDDVRPGRPRARDGTAAMVDYLKGMDRSRTAGEGLCKNEKGQISSMSFGRGSAALEEEARQRATMSIAFRENSHVN